MALIEVERERDSVVVTPTTARLDAAVAPAFKQAVAALVEAGDRRLALDLQRVSFMDSSGLGALVSILKALGPQGAIAVCNLSPSVQSLFKLTRMDKVFAITSGRAEAMARLGA